MASWYRPEPPVAPLLSVAEYNRDSAPEPRHHPLTEANLAEFTASHGDSYKGPYSPGATVGANTNRHWKSQSKPFKTDRTKVTTRSLTHPEEPRTDRASNVKQGSTAKAKLRIREAESGSVVDLPGTLDRRSDVKGKRKHLRERLGAYTPHPPPSQISTIPLDSYDHRTPQAPRHSDARQGLTSELKRQDWEIVSGFVSESPRSQRSYVKFGRNPSKEPSSRHSTLPQPTIQSLDSHDQENPPAHRVSRPQPPQELEGGPLRWHSDMVSPSRSAYAETDGYDTPPRSFMPSPPAGSMAGSSLRRMMRTSFSFLKVSFRSSQASQSTFSATARSMMIMSPPGMESPSMDYGGSMIEDTSEMRIPPQTWRRNGRGGMRDFIQVTA
ncbi:hypothetical protein BKA70DRAFT_1513933 [Coprinopsis sp. MPI-PUGE-AT-0042]|nr:hypothetical protein BKA70DRAFT_1513933 [Coprinopsis sp. MPI-PUGE-AT-0042]